MKPYTKTTLATLVTLVAISGCTGTKTTSVNEPQTTPKKALNQPIVDLNNPPLDEVLAAVPNNAKGASKGVTRSVSGDHSEPLAGTVTPKRYEENDTSPLVASNWDTQNKPLTVHPYEITKGDTYAEILATWMRSSGFTDVKTKLVAIDQYVLDKEAQSDDVIVDTLPLAIEALIAKASTGMVQMQMNHPLSKYNEKKYKSVMNGFYISYNGDAATVYSATPDLLVHQKGEKTKSVTTPLTSYKGETYEATLTRWLNNAGYLRIGKLLNDSTQKAIKEKVTKTTVFNESLERAATLLLYTARLKAQDDERNERDNFLSDQQKENIGHHLYLDADKKEAILTSSNKPVVMFNVEPGSLKSNFLALAKDMKWVASESHFMTPDYELTFGYPIVAEQGNMKDALSVLLKDFPNLRGAIVPSTRQVYVLMEKI